MRGAIAAGHQETVDAGASVLLDGGNAFDAALAALTAAFAAEPVLASPAGGGFLLAQPADAEPRVYDFFVQTPRSRRPRDELDFHPVDADFGNVTQEFHIGLGTVAVPGMLRGMFEIQRDLATRSMAELMRPGIELARRGVTVTPYQAHLLDIIEPCYTATPEVRGIFGSRSQPDRLVRAGDALRQPQLADSLAAIAIEGDELFYRGELGQRLLDAQATGGGQLTPADLAGYAVARRPPLSVPYRGATVHTNPPPASGGPLVAFGLQLLAGWPTFEGSAGDPDHLERLALVMDATQEARVAATAADGELHDDLLDPHLVERYRRSVLGRQRLTRGTTHISVADGDGNLASLTVSNGEGSGHVVPGSGVVLNNMLGEEDLNPGGFQRWPPGHRMTSMMAPTLVAWPDGRRAALGSGGSNRIRTAILQVLHDLIDLGLPLSDAIERPRIHVERGLLSVEGGVDPAAVEPLAEAFEIHHWDDRSMFFGGVHAVMATAAGLSAAADPRRDGRSRVLP
jgi:gamma-glutamyltranspeptidase/glutathione hydrolase